MDYPHDFATNTGVYSINFGLSANADLQPQHFHHDFDTQQSTTEEQQNGYAMESSLAGQKMSCDVKPRLTKEQHDILEAHYQKQQKPNTNTKRGFAETLNVSLEKVNNWFQNRRAKSKQDAKKQQGPTSLFSISQSSTLSLAGTSDSDTSPAYASTDYLQMMQACESDDELLVAHPAANAYEQPQPHANMANPQLLAANAELANYNAMLDLQELNRRTLTQEQFDAFAQQEMMLSSGNLAMLTADSQAMDKLLMGYNAVQHTDFMMHAQDIPRAFPTHNTLQEHAISAPSSEWTDSRSSSASLSNSLEQQHITMPQQWQPGQSVPVDVDQLNQEFQKVSQHRQSISQEQPLPWPENDLVRRDSSTSLITQSLGNVGINTPQPQQAPFKSPAPVSSLAARRQRQRPAALGIASLRSQSYSGSAQPLGSPGQMQPPSSTTPPQLRRIKSSNVVGGVGRVQKNIAPPQRSPLNWSFTDAMTSPQAIRHPSALAPPTPMSPPDGATEQAMKIHWHNTQASISETDAEHALAYTQNFTSPPHTPMFQQPAQFMPPQMMPGRVLMENTPPQSAPASQQCFPQGVFGHSPQHMHQFQQPMMFQPSSMPAQMMYMPTHMGIMEEQMHRPQFTVTTSGPPPEMPLHFAPNGLPIVDSQGQIALAMPSQLQFVQQKAQRVEKNGQIPAGSQSMFSINPEVMPLQITAQVPKHSAQAPSDFFVHEYTPPQDIKRTATPRKPVDTGPKNYTFANQTPEHFEKSKKSDKSSSSSSPDSLSA